MGPSSASLLSSDSCPTARDRISPDLVEGHIGVSVKLHRARETGVHTGGWTVWWGHLQGHIVSRMDLIVDS